MIFLELRSLLCVITLHILSVSAQMPAYAPSNLPEASRSYSTVSCPGDNFVTGLNFKFSTEYGLQGLRIICSGDSFAKTVGLEVEPSSEFAQTQGFHSFQAFLNNDAGRIDGVTADIQQWGVVGQGTPYSNGFKLRGFAVVLRKDDQNGAQIQAIQPWFTDNYATTPSALRMDGGLFGNFYSFQCAPGKAVTEIVGQFSEDVYQIKVICSDGQESPLFGSDTGYEFKYTNPSGIGRIYVFSANRAKRFLAARNAETTKGSNLENTILSVHKRDPGMRMTGIQVFADTRINSVGFMYSAV